MHGKSLVWTSAVATAFEIIKHKLTDAPLLVLPDFTTPFELHSDASKMGIGIVLSQGGRPLAYLSEKVTDVGLRYSTYDIELYVVVRAV